MSNEKQLIRWEKHYSDGSVEYTDETSTKNFSENLSCADGLIVSRSYIQMKPVNWHTLEQKLNKHNVSSRIISGCFDCPFNYEYDMAVSYGCKLDTENRSIKQSKKYQPITPDWCPVKKDSVVVKYDR